jgi:hypothetical protein
VSCFFVLLAASVRPLLFRLRWAQANWAPGLAASSARLLFRSLTIALGRRVVSLTSR